jgi:hypothetical protein
MRGVSQTPIPSLVLFTLYIILEGIDFSLFHIPEMMLTVTGIHNVLNTHWQLFISAFLSQNGCRLEQ